MKERMIETVVDTIEFINKRVISGWNAKDEHERSFELSQASKMLEELSLSIRCELSRQEELATRVRKAQKDAA